MPADSKADLVTDYLDDALEAGDAESFERDLDEDARREVEDLQKILSIVRELPDVQAPPDFYENVAKKIRKRRGGAEGMPVSLVSLPFQVLSILVIMVIAATYLMLEIERESAPIEKDPSAAKAKDQAPE